MKWGSNEEHKVEQHRELILSSLYNEETFYSQFITDLQNASKEAIIESPYITTKRLQMLVPIFLDLKLRNIY